MTTTLGLDVGKTKTRAGIVDAQGTIRRVAEVPTPRRHDAEEAYGDILAAVRRLQVDDDVSAIGVAVSGSVDPVEGSTLDGGGSSLVRFPLAQRLRADTGLAATIDNDANFAALAEARIGAGRGRATVVYLTLSTGIGCGIVRDGEIVRGAHNGAGEIFDVPLASSAQTVEGAAGGRALAEAATRHRRCETTTAELFALAAAGDPSCTSLVDGAVDALRACYAWICALIDPDVVVVGGSVARHQPQLVDALADRAHRPRDARPPVLRGDLGADAELLGAGLAAQAAARSAAV